MRHELVVHIFKERHVCAGLVGKVFFDLEIDADFVNLVGVDFDGLLQIVVTSRSVVD